MIRKGYYRRPRRSLFVYKTLFPGRNKTHHYNFLSFLLRYNKSITVSLFVTLSGFLFIYCSSTPSAVLKEVPAVKKTYEKTGEPESPKDPEVIISGSFRQETEPDLRNIFSILALDYSDKNLHGIFWGEHNFDSKVYLSFDDGPNMSFVDNGSDKKTVCDSILDILRARDLKAVFFINGRNLEYISPYEKQELRRVLYRMINEGHLIGNHSYSHHNLAKGRFADGMDDEKEIASEFILTQDSLNELMGFVYPLVLVRPPYAEPGRTDDLDNWLISERQYLISLQYDSYDYAYKENGFWNKEALYERMETLLSGQENGGVLLLHELDSTAEMLPNILDMITIKKGYTVEKMENLLEKKYGRKS